jgi:hypothetical protein
MTRIYFEKDGFKNFCRAYAEKKELRQKFNIYCVISENENGTMKLNVTSVKEDSQNLLRSYGFKEIKAETL